MKPTRQMPLPFSHQATYDPAEFVEDDSNAEARAWLEAAWPTRRLALWGAPGCGKTHLLHVWARHRGRVIRAGPGLRTPPDLPDGTAVAIDDADSAPEEALLHFLNLAAEDDLCVLLAARTAPSRWPTRLPDLASRLRAVPAVAITPPGDAMLANLFTILISSRQLVVPDTVQRWLLTRLPREPATLREVSERLDHAALAAGGRITPAIAAYVLEGLPGGGSSRSNTELEDLVGGRGPPTT